MGSFVVPRRSTSRHLSDADFRPTGGAGTMDKEGFVSYHAFEYVIWPPTTTRSLTDYGREAVILATKRQVERLLSLRRPSWDSYGASPVNPDALERATRFVLYLVDQELLAPRLYPLSDGGVRLEWSGTQGEIWINIPPSGDASAYFIDEQTNQEWEGPLDDSPGELLELLSSMR